MATLSKPTKINLFAQNSDKSQLPDCGNLKILNDAKSMKGGSILRNSAISKNGKAGAASHFKTPQKKVDFEALE